MTKIKFTATEPTYNEITVPFIEENDASQSPNYSSKKTIQQAQQVLTAELAKLNGHVIRYQDGRFGEAPKVRFGYRVHFTYLGAAAVFHVVGLPIKRYTENKHRQVLVQALLNKAAEFQAMRVSQIHSIDSYPLIQYLLVDPSDPEVTIGQRIIEAHELPTLQPPKPQSKITVERVTNEE